MKVYKFGGASVKSAAAVKNVSRIIQKEKGKLLVVVSAMGKTTNALERVHGLARADEEWREEFVSIRDYYWQIAKELVPPPKHSEPIGWGDKLYDGLAAYGLEIEMATRLKGEFGHSYDQLVSWGEIISTHIVSIYLNNIGIKNKWLDARAYIVTDSKYREATVNWPATRQRIASIPWDAPLIITQGFIGGNEEKQTTTLGREGSDFSAAIFANCLEAESVTIWKDVPGVMNADPKRLPAAIVFDELPFQEAAEMTYYGASVIHPKTIKPLANANIPLIVKNFDDTSLPGTRIHECKLDHIQPLIVFKDNQCLISCKVTDYTFVSEDQLSSIFKALADHGIKINMMQNSAISFSFCADYRENKIRDLIETLSRTFEVYYNTQLTLITIKNYTTELSNEYRNKKGILLEQLSRSTLQILVKGNAVA